jgi:hypothetical protein
VGEGMTDKKLEEIIRTTLRGGSTSGYNVHNSIKDCMKQAIEADREGRWVSVNDRLPEVVNGQYSKRLLVFGNRNGITDIHIGVYHLTGKFYGYGEDVDVTHWQSLPPTPTEG